MTNIADIRKESELSNRIFQLYDDMTYGLIPQSNLQGAIEAVIMEAIAYGRGAK